MTSASLSVEELPLLPEEQHVEHGLPLPEDLSTTRKAIILISLWVAVLLAGLDMSMQARRASFTSLV
jgi:hypothetical protein